MFPDRGRRPFGLALLAGFALGAIGFGGGGPILYEAGGLPEASAGLLATLLVSLAAGVWAGAPSASEEEPPSPRPRWFAAGLLVGLAGAYATVWTAFEGVRAGLVGRVLALPLLVALPAYAVGFLLPALLLRLDEEQGERGWGILGAVVVGAMVGTGAGGFLVASVLAPLLGPGPLLLGTAAALIVPTLLPEEEEEETAERLLHRVESPFGVIQVTEVLYPGERQPERRLYLNDEEESGELVRSGAPTLAYIAAAERWLSAAARRGDRYLFLGGGAYTLPRRIAERDPSAAITVVELDPEVTRSAYRFFGLRPEHRIASLHGDARAAVERAEPGSYDRVYLDVYVGTEAIPYSLVTREAFGSMRRLLRPGGTLAVNAIGVMRGEESVRFWSTVRTLCDVFPAVAVYVHLGREFPERQNALLAASMDADYPFPEPSGMFERWPRDEWPEPEGVIVFRDVFPAAREA